MTAAPAAPATSTADEPPELTRDIVGLAALFLVSGTTHLVRPDLFEPLVPRALPTRRGLVHASGLAELACGVGLLYPRTRRVAGWASAALLLAVFPGNVQMSVSHGKRAARRQDATSRATFAATVARLPVQVPLIRTALRAAGRL
jgi:uncharacterized membrane protein